MEKIYLSLHTVKRAGDDDVTTWIQLTPLGTFQGEDGRGPFIIENAESVIAASFAKHAKLAIDINHAIDLKGAKGEEAPAVGWIDKLEVRSDGIYGHVEWTKRGQEIMAAREYGFISPVLMMATRTKPIKVVSIARASLCNDPNLKDLKSLHLKDGENAMLKELLAVLGLPEGDEKTAIEAVKSLNTKAAAYDETVKALQTATKSEDSDPKTLVASLQTQQAQQTKSDDGEKADLKKQVDELAKELNTTRTQAAREKAITFVEKGIAEFKIVPSLKDHFIARHMRAPEEVEAEVKAIPAMMSNGLKNYNPDEKSDGLSAEEKQIAALMGVDPKLVAEQKKKEIL